MILQKGELVQLLGLHVLDVLLSLQLLRHPAASEVQCVPCVQCVQCSDETARPNKLASNKHRKF